MSDEAKMTKEERLAVVRSHFNSRRNLFGFVMVLGMVAIQHESVMGAILFTGLMGVILWAIHHNADRIMKDIRQRY
ncbi:hypothetical protein EPO05_01980 [Patescibacteria group bacterium]|nr:MAG: hypothetical protein EPO05_01980 [Patescibacteria group bacterium]